MKPEKKGNRDERKRVAKVARGFRLICLVPTTSLLLEHPRISGQSPHLLHNPAVSVTSKPCPIKMVAHTKAPLPSPWSIL